MGKIRAKHRNKSRRRPQPTGIPSVKEEEELQDLEPAPQPDIPVLEKVCNVFVLLCIDYYYQRP